MKIIILGAGQVGSSLISGLLNTGHDITVVDNSPDALAKISDKFDIRTLVGQASHPDVLADAGASSTDILIAVTHVDEVNLTASQIAHTLFKVPTRVARIRETSFYKYESLFKNKAFHTNAIIYPEVQIAGHLAHIIDYPSALQVINFKKDLTMIAMKAVDGAPIVGQPIHQLKRHIPQADVRVIAIFRESEFILPVAKTIIHDNDEIYLITHNKYVDQVMEEFREEPKVSSIVIAGGGHIGRKLACMLQNKYLVKIIEKNRAICEDISSEIKKSLIIHGSSDDYSLLKEENIEKADIFCALTNSDEINIMSSLSSKYLGAKSSIALVKNPSYYMLLQHYNLDIDITVSPRELTLNAILSYIHAGNIEKTHSVREGQSEIIEALIHKNSPLIGKKIEEINLPENTYIGAIMRHDGKGHIAHSNDRLETLDEVIIFLSDYKDYEAIADIFNE